MYFKPNVVRAGNRCCYNDWSWPYCGHEEGRFRAWRRGMRLLREMHPYFDVENDRKTPGAARKLGLQFNKGFLP